MPKLSAYVAGPGSDGEPPQSQQQQQQQRPGGEGGGAAACAPRPAAAQQQQQPPRQPQQQPLQLPSSVHTAAGSPLGQQRGLEPQHHEAAAKLQADFAKRLREHGPRTYRWPDGSLRPECPPPSPQTVANRRLWAPLVRHCRTHGGDSTYERTGISLRHGLGVPYDQHAAYLAHAGLTPETDAAGRFVGEVAGLPRPLDDPQHCFHTYYKEGADAVFSDKLGRLL